MDRDAEFWIIRHGETEWSRTGRHTGRTDLPLTAVGEEQAAGLRGRLGGHHFALVLSSPLRRAWDTCRLAGLDDLARTTPDLVEWDYGTYEGRTTSEIRAEKPGWSIWTGAVPGGETAEEVGVRALRIIEEAVAVSGDVALFGHGHALRILTACWLGLSPLEGRLFTLNTASIGVLGYEGATRVIRTWNT
jgi:probable phosphoglycerate mutase